MSCFASFHPILQTLVATLFAWFVTALGSAIVFFKKDINRKILDTSLGFSAGIMISASFFSLLLPSIEISSKGSLAKWFPVSVGFMCDRRKLYVTSFCNIHDLWLKEALVSKR